MRVNTSQFGQTVIYLAAGILAATAILVPIDAQPQPAADASVRGYVRDSKGTPVANATVFLQLATTEALRPASEIQVAHTTSEGTYRFDVLREGAYIVGAEMIGYRATTVGPVNLAPKGNAKIDLLLALTKASEPAVSPPVTADAKPAEFFDEPQFTVAGVTQATNSGGHGPEIVARTTETLAKATASLTKDPGDASQPVTAAVTEESLRNAVARNPKDPELHHRLGDVEEKMGNPLEAVREYQRAAEIEPSEPNLFDWGAELLTHRAVEPAAEVFTKGHRLFPNSARFPIALGVAAYARGSYDQAAQYLVSASDLAPENPTPYLFLGRMQSAGATPSVASLDRLARFARLQPDNALSNYYYAAGLWKQAAGSVGTELSARIEALLQNAVRLDPKLSAAYLQLGILYAQRGDFSQAISPYQRAIEASPEESSSGADEMLEEAHYRLAQAYLRTGETAKGQAQLQLRTELAEKKKKDAERERQEIQEFVVSLRGGNSASPPQP